jgi:hypothetical protein
MRIFVYKTLIIIVSLFFLYQFTVGYTIQKIQSKFFSIYDEDVAKEFKLKIKDEIKKGTDKDRIFTIEEALLLKKFIKKIEKEINLDN